MPFKYCYFGIISLVLLCNIGFIFGQDNPSCTYINPSGQFYNFNPLTIHPGGKDYSIADPYGNTYYANICAPANNSGEHCTPNGQGVCERTLSGQYFGFGSASSWQFSYNTTSNSVVLQYFGGSNSGCSSNRQSAIELVCDYTASTAKLTNVVQIGTCAYGFTLTSLYNCPISTGPTLPAAFSISGRLYSENLLEYNMTVYVNYPISKTRVTFHGYDGFQMDHYQVWSLNNTFMNQYKVTTLEGKIQGCQLAQYATPMPLNKCSNIGTNGTVNVDGYECTLWSGECHNGTTTFTEKSCWDGDELQYAEVYQLKQPTKYFFYNLNYTAPDSSIFDVPSQCFNSEFTSAVDFDGDLRWLLAQDVVPVPFFV